LRSVEFGATALSCEQRLTSGDAHRRLRALSPVYLMV
jgi:hypothetical protein